MENLTKDNYFSKSKALSQSKIKDYSVCPNFFYRKHILGEVEDADSDAFLFGTIVDKLISGEMFDTQYKVVERRTKKLKEDAEAAGETLLTQTQYEEIFEVADAVEKTDAFKTLKEKAITQDILHVPFPINEHFDSLSGRPDFWWQEDGVGYLVDLKTARTCDPKQYYYHAMTYGYANQLAMYGFLLGQLHPEIKEFRYFNLVAAKTKDVYGVELFEFPTVVIQESLKWLMQKIEEISKETEYKKYNPSFSSPVIFGDL